MEFSRDFDSELIVIPRGHAFGGSAPDGPGMQWSAKYAIVAANGLHLPIVLDGLNERGLACGLFWRLQALRKQQDAAMRPMLTNPLDTLQSAAPWAGPRW